MAPNPATATCIVNSMSSLWKDETLADFTVIVEDSIFKCHRFILAACSRFFYALFTTDMVEKKDNTARLHDVESSALELILKVLYTGEDMVNEDNVLSVWQCAHRLQISFLMEQCENFALSNMSINNYKEFSKVASSLDSQKIQAAVDTFILKNFTKIKDDNFFLEYNAGKLIELIRSDDLEVTCEDDVLLLIYKWVECSINSESGLERLNDTNNGDSDVNCLSIDTFRNETIASDAQSNTEAHKDATKSREMISENLKSIKDIFGNENLLENRSIYLLSLLKASRSYLASPQCLLALYNHRLTQSDEGAKKVIFDSLIYQVRGYHHGYFPTAALYRNSSEFEHVGVIVHDTGTCKSLSLARNNMYVMPECKLIKNRIKIALFDRKIYAVGQADDSTCKLCILNGSSWESIAELPGLRYLLLSHKSFLYAFNAFNGKVLRMNPNSFDKTPKKLKHSQSFTDVEFAMSFQEYILVFSQDSVGGKEETSIHVMNTLDETWHKLENLDGPSKNMASFQDDDKVYLLQNNGNLWRAAADDAEMITFQLVKKIWDVKESLRGALLYKGTLFLYLKLPWVNTILNSVPGVYNSLKKWAKDDYASNFICTVMHNLEMVKK